VDHDSLDSRFIFIGAGLINYHTVAYHSACIGVHTHKKNTHTYYLSILGLELRIELG